jgi:hypothetical protein
MEQLVNSGKESVKLVEIPRESFEIEKPGALSLLSAEKFEIIKPELQKIVNKWFAKGLIGDGGERDSSTPSLDIRTREKALGEKEEKLEKSLVSQTEILDVSKNPENKEAQEVLDWILGLLRSLQTIRKDHLDKIKLKFLAADKADVLISDITDGQEVQEMENNLNEKRKKLDSLKEDLFLVQERLVEFVEILNTLNLQTENKELKNLFKKRALELCSVVLAYSTYVKNIADNKSSVVENIDIHRDNLLNSICYLEINLLEFFATLDPKIFGLGDQFAPFFSKLFPHTMTLMILNLSSDIPSKRIAVDFLSESDIEDIKDASVKITPNTVVTEYRELFNPDKAISIKSGTTLFAGDVAGSTGKYPPLAQEIVATAVKQIQEVVQIIIESLVVNGKLPVSFLDYIIPVPSITNGDQFAVVVPKFLQRLVRLLLDQINLTFNQALIVIAKETEEILRKKGSSEEEIESVINSITNIFVRTGFARVGEVDSDTSATLSCYAKIDENGNIVSVNQVINSRLVEDIDTKARQEADEARQVTEASRQFSNLSTRRDSTESSFPLGPFHFRRVFTRHLGVIEELGAISSVNILERSSRRVKIEQEKFMSTLATNINSYFEQRGFTEAPELEPSEVQFAEILVTTAYSEKATDTINHNNQNFNVSSENFPGYFYEEASELSSQYFAANPHLNNLLYTDRIVPSAEDTPAPHESLQMHTDIANQKIEVDYPWGTEFICINDLVNRMTGTIPVIIDGKEQILTNSKLSTEGPGKLAAVVAGTKEELDAVEEFIFNLAEKGIIRAGIARVKEQDISFVGGGFLSIEKGAENQIRALRKKQQRELARLKFKGFDKNLERKHLEKNPINFKEVEEIKQRHLKEMKGLVEELVDSHKSAYFCTNLTDASEVLKLQKILDKIAGILLDYGEDNEVEYSKSLEILEKLKIKAEQMRKSISSKNNNGGVEIPFIYIEEDYKNILKGCEAHIEFIKSILYDSTNDSFLLDNLNGFEDNLTLEGENKAA